MTSETSPGDEAAAWAPAGGRPEDLPLAEWVGQALGSASVCWANPGGAGEFDSARCAWVFDGLMAHLTGVIGGTATAVSPPGGAAVVHFGRS